MGAARQVRKVRTALRLEGVKELVEKLVEEEALSSRETSDAGKSGSDGGDTTIEEDDDDDEEEEEEEECDVDVTGSQRGGVFQLSEHANKLQSTSPSLHDDLSRPSSSSRCAPLISTAIFILKVTLRRSSATSAASACGATELKNAACCSSGRQPLPWNWSLMACSMRFRLSEKR